LFGILWGLLALGLVLFAPHTFTWGFALGIAWSIFSDCFVDALKPLILKVFPIGKRQN
jgi:hypothetical protein